MTDNIIPAVDGGPFGQACANCASYDAASSECTIIRTNRGYQPRKQSLTNWCDEWRQSEAVGQGRIYMLTMLYGRDLEPDEMIDELVAFGIVLDFLRSKHPEVVAELSEYVSTHNANYEVNQRFRRQVVYTGS